MTARDWRAAALCAREADLDLHFREDEASVAKAKALCGRCEVRTPCAQAGKDEPWGVVAGLTPGERLGLMLLATPEPPPHVASRGCYTSGCQRPECRAENTRWMSAYRAREHADPAVTGGRIVDLGEQLTFTLESA